MRRNISTISNSKQNSNTNNLNRSKSPKRVVNGVKLYNFSQIQSYRYINKPYLNEMKKEHIREKLDLQKTTEARVGRRIKRNDMFVPFNHNPFSQQRLSKSLVNIALQDKNLPPEDKLLMDEKNNTSKNNTSRNIIDEIGNLKKKKLDREVQSRQLVGVQLRAKNFSGLIQRQLNNSKISLHRQKKEMNKSMIALVTPKPKVQEVFDEHEIQKLSGEIDFDDIISMREERHQQRKSKQMNIFKLLHDKQFFNKKFTTLDKYFFSFNSIYDKFQKYKITFYRDMSRDSRSNVSKKPVGKIDNMQTISQNELQFNDLMNVAAGRFTPQAVYNQLNFQKFNQNNYSDAQEDQIPYGQNNVNKGIVGENYDQSIKEVQQFLKLALNKKEQSYLKLNVHRKQAMRRQLDQVKKLINISIYDKKIHKNLREQVNNELEVFVNQNYRYPKTAPDRDALIRDHKEQKGKQQIIKLKQLVESFQIVKEHDSKVNQLINRRI